MINAFQSALTGLRAFGTKLGSHANNVANSQSSEYKRTRVTLSDAIPGGVKADVEQIRSPGDSHYELTENGYELIELSNVNLVEEITQSNLTATFYKANLKTVQVADEMTKDILNIKA